MVDPAIYPAVISAVGSFAAAGLSGYNRRIGRQNRGKIDDVHTLVNSNLSEVQAKLQELITANLAGLEDKVADLQKQLTAVTAERDVAIDKGERSQ